MVVVTTQYLCQQNYNTDDVAIITPFLRQLHPLGEVLRAGYSLR